MAEIFYAPGLGDERVVGRQHRYVEWLNRRRERQIFFFDPKWQTPENAEAKLGRLHSAYEEAGRPQTLFGVSAGATMAVILGAEHRETKVVTLAGKHKGSATIGAERRTRAPALAEFVDMSEAILDANQSVQQRMTSYRPFLFDAVVPMDDIVISGAQNKTLVLPFHMAAIFSGLATVLPRL